MKIAKWFLDNEYTASERYAMECTEPSIEKETEKAFLLKFDTKYGVIKGWFPKSVCSDEEIEKTEKTEYSVGMKVYNKDFGGGEIVKMNGNIVTVKFGRKERNILADSRFLKVV